MSCKLLRAAVYCLTKLCSFLNRIATDQISSDIGHMCCRTIYTSIYVYFIRNITVNTSQSITVISIIRTVHTYVSQPQPSFLCSNLIGYRHMVLLYNIYLYMYVSKLYQKLYCKYLQESQSYYAVLIMQLLKSYCNCSNLIGCRSHGLQ